MFSSLFLNFWDPNFWGMFPFGLCTILARGIRFRAPGIRKCSEEVREVLREGAQEVHPEGEDDEKQSQEDRAETKVALPYKYAVLTAMPWFMEGLGGFGWLAMRGQVLRSPVFTARCK